MVVSVRTRALMFLLMAARVLGPLPSLTRLPSSPARRRRGAPALALPPRALSMRRSLPLTGAPAPAASWIAGHTGRPARSRAWVLPLRSRYRGLGRSRGAMSGARRATGSYRRAGRRRSRGSRTSLNASRPDLPVGSVPRKG